MISVSSISKAGGGPFDKAPRWMNNRAIRKGTSDHERDPAPPPAAVRAKMGRSISLASYIRRSERHRYKTRALLSPGGRVSER